MEEEAAFILKSMSTQTQGNKSKSDNESHDSPIENQVKIEN